MIIGLCNESILCFCHLGAQGSEGDGGGQDDWIPPPPEDPGVIQSSAGNLPPVETNLLDEANGSHSGGKQDLSRAQAGLQTYKLSC
jgi:hypothetical protein